MERRHFAAALIAFILIAAAWQSAPAADSSRLMVALRGLPAQADKFRSMMSDLNAGQFRLVNVQDAMSAGDRAAYRASVKKEAAGIADLRDTLTHTTVTGTDGVVVPLKKVLLARNVTIDQIVAVYVDSGGEITLFYE